MSTPFSSVCDLTVDWHDSRAPVAAVVVVAGKPTVVVVLAVELDEPEPQAAVVRATPTMAARRGVVRRMGSPMGRRPVRTLKSY